LEVGGGGLGDGGVEVVGDGGDEGVGYGGGSEMDGELKGCGGGVGRAEGPWDGGD